MHAILRVDLQARVGAVIVAHDLINAGRTIALLRRVVERQIVGDRHFGVGQGQMGGLIFLVIGAR